MRSYSGINLVPVGFGELIERAPAMLGAYWEKIVNTNRGSTAVGF
jgi:hypothetical protein